MTTVSIRLLLIVMPRTNLGWPRGFSHRCVITGLIRMGLKHSLSTIRLHINIPICDNFREIYCWDPCRMITC